MILGAIIGIAVENLEESGYGENLSSVVRKESTPLHGETASSSNIKSHDDHTQTEPTQDKYKDTHTSLLGKLLDEFVTVFRAAANGLTPNLILFVFLPILIFESAYNMEAREVIKNLLPITVLALPGLLLSTVMCGVGVMLAGGQDFGITWEVALLFGVIVSATDPVAVVGLFKELGAPKRLSILVSLSLSVQPQPGKVLRLNFFQAPWNYSRFPVVGLWWGYCLPGSVGASLARSLKICPSRYHSPS
jgi:hypothetical protein